MRVYVNTALDFVERDETSSLVRRPGATHFVENDDPVELRFEPLYELLEPAAPLFGGGNQTAVGQEHDALVYADRLGVQLAIRQLVERMHCIRMDTGW